MLSSLRVGSSDRIRQSFVLLQHLKQLEAANDSSIEELVKVQKGMLFVSFYACIEYTLINGVSEFLANLQAAPLPPRRYQVGLLPAILNREFNAVTGASKRTLWAHKLNLVQRIFSSDAGTIDNDVFPAEGNNISADHFADVWKHLHLPGDSIPAGVNPWVINEIKEHRNAIAHGRERAASVGSRFTSTSLEDRHRAVEALCAHVVLALEEHLARQTFLLPP